MIAMKRIYYPKGTGSGRDIAVGEEFDALSDRDADRLLKVRYAKFADDAPKDKSQPLELPRLAEAKTAAADKPAADLPTPSKRTYQRRDMEPKP
jgi:hypothetical protein